MPFQSRNTTVTLIFDQLIHAFLVKETLFPSTVTTGSWFQHHTHKPTSHLLLWCSEESFHYHLHWKVVPDWFQHGSLSDHQSAKCGMNFALTWHILSFSVQIWLQYPMLMPTLSATSRTVKRWFPGITPWTISTWSSFVNVEGRPGLRSSPTDFLPSLKRLNHSYYCVRLIQSSPYS